MRKLSAFFFFVDPETPEIYTLSLHDALPIYLAVIGTVRRIESAAARVEPYFSALEAALRRDRKSTRLNSSHANISYAVFCLKKKTEGLRDYAPNAYSSSNGSSLFYQ